MKTNRKKTRTYLFQALYSLYFNEFEKESFYTRFFEWVFDFVIDEEYFDEMFTTIVKEQSVLLEIINKYAPKFDLKNMHIVYLIPMLIWITEMLYLKEEIPWKVSINESVEIAKVFWDTSAKKIVNWVLNKIFEDNETLTKNLSKLKWIKDFQLFNN